MMARTVLVVDDATSIRQMVAYTLTQAGFEVIEAANGKLGLDQLERCRVDLVVTDLHMPVMDGITFIRELRGRQQTRFTPVLMLTTESQAEKKQQAKAAGATGWIVKPFHPEKLLDVIARVLL
jgi:two-component system chemotaxis response regulator CheY